MLRNGVGSLSDQASDLLTRLETTVRSHLMSDVPLGLFLSGGIDSTGIAALMAPMVQEPIRTFAVGYQEPEANEVGYARLAARAVGAQHHEVMVTPQDLLRELPQLVWHEDKPIAFPSSVSLYCVSRLASRHVKVVLTGEGADELFLGYNRYRVTAWNQRLGETFSAFAPTAVRRELAGLITRLPRQLRRYAERTFLAMPPDLRSLFHENFAVFPRSLRDQLLRHRALRDADPYSKHVALSGDSPAGVLDQMSRSDLQTYLVELLMKQDRMSMAASIESRVPYLDHELVEHAVALPQSLKVRGWTTKRVLRKAFDGRIPREILQRKKMGFPVPVARWLRGPLRTSAEELVGSPRALDRGLFEPDLMRRLLREHSAGTADHADRLWLLMNFEIWQRTFLDDAATPVAQPAAHGGDRRLAEPIPTRE
jgi:asparagine synthase (glutamine-hydrolysing)